MAAAAIISAVLSALSKGSKNEDENKTVPQYNYGQAAQATPMQQNTQPQVGATTQEEPTGGQ